MKNDIDADSKVIYSSKPSDKWVRAKYRKPEEMERIHRYNALIATLPPLLSLEAAIDRLAFQLKYDETDRQGSREARCMRASALFMHREPLSSYYNFYLMFYSLLHNGYASRNPIPKLAVKQLKSGCDNVEHISEETVNNDWPDISLVMSILGCTGVGKTCMAKQVLQAFPQVYKHHKYEGIAFEQAQITWLRLECPTKGSVKSLVMDCFHQIDGLVGSTHYTRMVAARYSVERLLIELAEVFKSFKLGALVIDEIQRLFLMIKNVEYENCEQTINASGKKIKSDPELLLEFFVLLTNKIKVPLIFVGTGDIERVFPSNLALARRFSQAGSIPIGRLEKDSNDWKNWLESLWRYQYTNKKFVLTDEIISAMYEETQGIIGPCISLYIFMQMEAIWSETETVDVSLVYSVAKRYLKPWQIALKLYRSGLDKVIEIPEIKLEPTFPEFLSKRQNRTTREDDENKDVSPLEMINKILEGKCSPETAHQIAKQVLKKYTKKKDLYVAIEEAIQMADGLYENRVEKDKKENDKTEKDSKKWDSNDLRNIATNEKKGGSIYEKFINSGVIRTSEKPSDRGK